MATTDESVTGHGYNTSEKERVECTVRGHIHLGDLTAWPLHTEGWGCILEVDSNLSKDGLYYIKLK